MGLEGTEGHSLGEGWPNPSTKSNRAEVVEMLLGEASNLGRGKQRLEAMME